MELHEKLQELRKSRGMTQEELAGVLFVSRTAISKWESGRGYPSIDSLKAISKFFSVSIDDLLDGEKLLTIAQTENRRNIQRICGVLFGAVDVLSLMLILLPLYPRTVDGYVYAVTLLSYREAASLNRAVYWVVFLALTAAGLVRLLVPKGLRALTLFSVALGAAAVLILSLAGESYAVTVAFGLLMLKGVLLFQQR